MNMFTEAVQKNKEYGYLPQRTVYCWDGVGGEQILFVYKYEVPIFNM
jgi:hypothetical protein